MILVLDKNYEWINKFKRLFNLAQQGTIICWQINKQNKRDVVMNKSIN